MAPSLCTKRVQVLFLAFDDKNNKDQGVLVWFSWLVKGARAMDRNITAKINWDGECHTKKDRQMIHTVTFDRRRMVQAFF